MTPADGEGPALTSPDRVLWPEAGFTKRDLRAYLDAVADRILPHLRDRPLTLRRYPRGVDQAGFFHKDAAEDAHPSVGVFEAWSESSKRVVHYPVLRDVAGLRWVAQVSGVELHPWLARTDRPERADVLTFDLDPQGGFDEVPPAAWALREVLDELGLRSVVKTSGKRGLHVLVPVERRYGYDVLRGTALAAARACADRHPDALTVQMRKAERGGRLLLDWSRNGGAQTLACAYSPRAHPAGAVSFPLRWEDVAADLDPAAFTLRTVPDEPDRWTDVPAPQRLERARAALESAGYAPEDQSPRARTREGPRD